ncbi:MAG: CopG family transcriptional regulator [Gammaproteobacteria bacterium]|nr:CopG family transcriptional regulator [Gammaproteobacteria bacterium]
MAAQKISISLSPLLYEFVQNYYAKHHCKHRSEVITLALRLLQQAELEDAYRDADEGNKEIDELFSITTLDGLDENETW